MGAVLGDLLLINHANQRKTLPTRSQCAVDGLVDHPRHERRAARSNIDGRHRCASKQLDVATELGCASANSLKLDLDQQSC
jgi:hypothetical protein